MTDQTETGANGAGERDSAKATKFGIDHGTGHLVLGTLRIRMPRTRIARMGIGTGLIFGGVLGFLPILGFWMLPLGVLVLSHDMHVARRLRRRTVVWWTKRRRPSE